MCIQWTKRSITMHSKGLGKKYTYLIKNNLHIILQMVAFGWIKLAYYTETDINLQDPKIKFGRAKFDKCLCRMKYNSSTCLSEGLELTVRISLSSPLTCGLQKLALFVTGWVAGIVDITQRYMISIRLFGYNLCIYIMI